MPELPHSAAPVPATPIGDLSGWWFEIRCDHCRRNVSILLDTLAAWHGKQMTVSAALRRLRCSGMRGDQECGRTPYTVTLVKIQMYGKTRQRMRELVVVGR